MQPENSSNGNGPDQSVPAIPGITPDLYDIAADAHHALDADNDPLQIVVSPPPGRQPSQATQLVELTVTAGIELFHAPNRRGFATVIENGHDETWPLNAQEFSLWLRHLYFRNTKRAVSTQIIKEAIATLEAQALFGDTQYPVSYRVAEQHGIIYLDLANENWDAVAIGPDGWEIVSTVPVKFYRSDGMVPLPYPERGGALAELRPFINIRNERDWILMTAWLLSALQPVGPYPVLLLYGEQGSGKSDACRVLRRLIDPSESPLRAIPPNERDLMVTAVNTWLMTYENVSHLPRWLSDAMCRLATGGGMSVHKLYKDLGQMHLDAQRPQVLNSIVEVATQIDLLSRSIVLHLPFIPDHERIPEQQFWSDFTDAQPRILGALLDAVSMALRNWRQVSLPKLPRMADFATWACAAAPACDWQLSTTRGVLTGADAFLVAYNTNQQEAVDLTLETSLLSRAVRTLVDQTERWEGSYFDLLDVLANIESTRARTAEWPKTPRKLSADLRRLAPALRTVGVVIKFQSEQERERREPGSGRRTVIVQKQECVNGPSQQSQ
jgi:hypothetical protein